MVEPGRRSYGNPAALRRRRLRRRRARRLLLTLFVLVLVGLLATALVGSGRNPVAAPTSGSTTRPKTSTTGRSGPPTSSTDAPSPADQLYPIGAVSRVYSEPGKTLAPPHSPGGSVAVVRQVAAEILYPAAAGTPGTGPTAGASPATDGPFPLVVFGPGFEQPTGEYSPILDAWASHGFVVAAVTFPLTNPSAPGGPYRPDILNQPADMATVASQVVAESADPTSPLHNLVNGSEVALAGQSDGGDTALALAYNTCCHLMHVSATVILSGSELQAYGGFPGAYFPSGRSLAPLLAFQGTDDLRFNPPARTNQFFAAAPQPKYLVCLNGANHLEAYTTDDTYEALVAQASIDYLDHYLWHQSGTLAAMEALVRSSAVASLASSCP